MVSVLRSVTGSVAAILSVTVCWPGIVVNDTESLKLPFGPAVVVPLNCPVHDGDAPAVTRTVAFGAVLPLSVKFRATAALGAGS